MPTPQAAIADSVCARAAGVLSAVEGARAQDSGRGLLAEIASSRLYIRMIVSI